MTDHFSNASKNCTSHGPAAGLASLVVLGLAAGCHLLAPTNHEIAVGPGFSDVSPHQVVRTSARVRTHAGSWLPSVRIEEHSLGGLDDGPSMIVTADGVAHLAFIDVNFAPRYWYDEGQGWKGDRQPPVVVTHTPSLGPDGAGGVILYAHGPPPVGDPAGEGIDLFSVHRPRGGAFDPAWTLYASGAYDSSISTRWAQLFQAEPWNFDLVYWTRQYPNELHLGVN